MFCLNKEFCPSNAASVKDFVKLLYSMSAPDYFLLLASFRFAGFFLYNSAQKVNILADIRTGVLWAPLNLPAEGLWATFF